MKRRHASKAWAAWAIGGVTLEVLTWGWGESGSTLSAHVWDVSHIPARPALNNKVRHGATVAFLAWVVAHFASGGRV